MGAKAHVGAETEQSATIELETRDARVAVGMCGGAVNDLPSEVSEPIGVSVRFTYRRDPSASSWSVSEINGAHPNEARGFARSFAETQDRNENEIASIKFRYSYRY
jgi:hypothetical protein